MQVSRASLPMRLRQPGTAGVGARMSFRLRLILLTAAAIAVTVTGASAAVWVIAKHQLRSQVDAGLTAQAGQALDSANSHRPSLYGQVPYAIVAGNGTVVRETAPIPVTKQVKQVASGAADEYFGDQTIDHTHFRVYAAGLDVGGAIVTVTSLAQTDRALHRIGFWVVLISFLGVAAAAALAAFVAAAALRPIRRLTAAADEVATTGNLAERVDVERGDELGQLATRFNAMLAALEKSVGAQRRLVADASHELRTPLTAARTNVDLLSEGKLPAEEARRAAAEASVELNALTTLVSDLVELARGEERKLRVEDVQLDDLVSSVVERAQARAPHVTFVTALSPSTVRADAVLLERAVSNLLDNAAKYSPDGAPIEVTVRGGEVVVTDHGPGISETDLPRVFDRFYRAASARSKPGAGLGLAIVREAAEAHGGRATAESTPAGARFRLTLPVTA
ncbi:MAG: ATP-binding protein [Gaiellaceae bacterium]